jgi:hypothetical protein
MKEKVGSTALNGSLKVNIIDTIFALSPLILAATFVNVVALPPFVSKRN